MLKSLSLTLFMIGLAMPAQAQRIELDGGNAGTVTIGPGETAIERSVRGHLTLDVNEGIGIDAGGSAALDVNGDSGRAGGGLSLGDTSRDDRAQTEGGDAVAVGQQTGSSSGQVSAFTPDQCSGADGFNAQRAAFLASDPLDAPVYIRRIDVTVCAYQSSPELVTFLQSMPAIREGLEHMEIDGEEIVSAGWTDDRGLLLYTARRD